MWQDLWAALALMLILEGIVPFLNPAGMRKVLTMLSELNETQMRYAGLTSMLLGVTLLYIVRN